MTSPPVATKTSLPVITKPSLPVVTKTPPPLDLRNVQGDILYGHVDLLSFYPYRFWTGLVSPRKPRPTIFFRIHNVDEFRSRLIQVLPLITTTAQVMKDREKISST
jgi:hypothetical protein